MKTNVHHICPISRCREFGLSPNEGWNKAHVDPRLHELYHRLFENMTPREIVFFLSKTFWKGRMPDLGDNNEQA